MVIISIFFNSISRSNRSLLSDLHPWTTDVLDDFSAPATTSQPKAAVPPTTVSEEAEEDNLDAVLDDDFAKQLAAGMEELMAGEDQEEFKETFEKIWKSFESTSLEDPNPSSNPVDPETKRSFQDTIAQTMNKLRDSSDKVEVRWRLMVHRLELSLMKFYFLRIKDGSYRRVRRCFYAGNDATDGVLGR